MSKSFIGLSMGTSNHHELNEFNVVALIVALPKPCHAFCHALFRDIVVVFAAWSTWTKIEHDPEARVGSYMR